MDYLDKIEAARHLGESFLMWLWYRSETHEGSFKLSDSSSLTLYFDNQITLEAVLADAERTQLSGGNPSVSEEAREALRSGKMVRSAKIFVSRHEREWKFTLSAQDLGITGLKIPALLTKANDEKLYERQALIEEITSLVRGLFDAFLRIRLDEQKWDIEAKSMQVWAHSDLD